MRMASKRSFLAAAAVLACSAPAVAQHGFTPEFASGATRPRSVALLPVEASVVRAKVAETQGLIDEGVVYGALFNEQVKALLAAKGYQIQVVDPDRINHDAQLQEYVVEAHRAFDDVMKQYRPKKLEKRIYNVGDPARLLASRLGVDAIAFGKVSITITPAGKAIVSALIGGSTAGATSNFAIVNGATGDLEAVQLGIVPVTPGDKTDQELQVYVAALAERATKRMPGADPSARIEIATATDGDLLDEVESLIK
jgi:hypothetical protein